MTLYKNKELLITCNENKTYFKYAFIIELKK